MKLLLESDVTIPVWRSSGNEKVPLNQVWKWVWKRILVWSSVSGGSTRESSPPCPSVPKPGFGFEPVGKPELRCAEHVGFEAFLFQLPSDPREKVVYS